MLPKPKMRTKFQVLCILTLRLFLVSKFTMFHKFGEQYFNKAIICFH